MSNNLYSVNAANLSSVVSTPPSLKNQLETRLDDVQPTIASLVEAPVPSKYQKRGRSKSERRVTQGRRDNSASKRERSSSKAKATRSTPPHTCTYEHCMRPTAHKTEDCPSAKLGAKIGTKSSRSPGRCVSDRLGLIATVSTTTAVATRHPQCPVVTTVDAEGSNTVAVAAKADGRSTTTRQNHLSEGVLTSQRPFATLSQ